MIPSDGTVAHSARLSLPPARPPRSSSAGRLISATSERLRTTAPTLARDGGWLVNPAGWECGAEHAKTGLAAGRARERARLSAGVGLLLGSRDAMCRR